MLKRMHDFVWVVHRACFQCICRCRVVNKLLFAGGKAAAPSGCRAVRRLRVWSGPPSLLEAALATSPTTTSTTPPTASSRRDTATIYWLHKKLQLGRGSRECVYIESIRICRLCCARRAPRVTTKAALHCRSRRRGLPRLNIYSRLGYHIPTWQRRVPNLTALCSALQSDCFSTFDRTWNLLASSDRLGNCWGTCPTYLTFF